MIQFSHIDDTYQKRVKRPLESRRTLILHILIAKLKFGRFQLFLQGTRIKKYLFCVKTSQYVLRKHYYSKNVYG